MIPLFILLETPYFQCSAKRGRPNKAKKKGLNQPDIVLKKKRGRPSLRTEAQDAPSSMPRIDLDSNLGSFTVGTSKRGKDLSEMEHLSTSVFTSSDPVLQEFPQSTQTHTQKQYRPIIADLGPIPLATSEEKQSVSGQRINDAMSPLSLCTETSTQNASPARSTISLQAGSNTVSRARHLIFC